MSERALWPGNVAAGAVLIGGVLIVALPRHALTIVQLVIVTVAVSTAVYILAIHVPQTGWISPFKWLSPFDAGSGRGRLDHRSGELDLIRAKLAHRRQPLGNVPALPPQLLRQLRPLIAGALDLDPTSEARLERAGERLSPLTFAVLTSEPLERATWFRTRRPDRRAVAEAVESILDEIDDLTDLPRHPRRSADSIHPRAR